MQAISCLLWLPGPHSSQANIRVIPPVSDLSPELGDIYMDLLGGPSQSVGNEQHQPFSILSTEQLTKLTHFFKLGIFGEGVQW